MRAAHFLREFPGIFPGQSVEKAVENVDNSVYGVDNCWGIRCYVNKKQKNLETKLVSLKFVRMYTRMEWPM